MLHPKTFALVALLGALACSNGDTATEGEDVAAPTVSQPDDASVIVPGKPCGGIYGDTCNASQYCAYPIGLCRAPSATGVCKARPQACTMNYDPVCACNVKTYSNACAAAAAGWSVIYKGSCKTIQ